MTARTPTEEHRSPHPFALALLYLPFGMPAGYVTVTLAYVLVQAGFSVEQVAGLVALSYVPQTWKFGWAPVVDTTLGPKRWYVIGAIGTAVGMLGTAFVPAQQHYFWALSVLVLISSGASTLVAMATEVLMTHSTHAANRGRAGGWSQAGNLGGGGLGGGLALWMSQHLAPWTGGAMLGLISLLCMGALRYYREPAILHAKRLNFLNDMRAVAGDVWSIARSRAGYLTLLVFLIPIGTGAAGGLWSAVADDWHTSADTVALVNGALGGVAAMLGCLVGGRLSDLVDRRTSYLLYGLLQAVAAVAMGAMTKTPTTFVFFTIVYTFFNGFIYAAYAAVVLDAIGRKSPATNFNVLASIANVPIAYMTLIEGHAQSRFGSSGMLYTESALALAAAICYIGVAAATTPRAAGATAGVVSE
jgi:MFS family permease